jgi:uncharacterized membrane protein YhaH (DUF805 family)
MKDNKYQLPGKLYFLDQIGFALAALGGFELITKKPIMPEAYQFAFYPWVFIVVGLLMTVPAIALVVKRNKESKKSL